MMVAKQKMLRTNEDWYPSFFEASDTGEKVAMVKVSFHHLGFDEFRVSVWGNDDFGVERDFNGPCQAWECYWKISAPVELDKLLADGFVPA